MKNFTRARSRPSPLSILVSMTIEDAADRYSPPGSDDKRHGQRRQQRTSSAPKPRAHSETARSREPVDIRAGNLERRHRKSVIEYEPASWRADVGGQGGMVAADRFRSGLDSVQHPPHHGEVTELHENDTQDGHPGM